MSRFARWAVAAAFFCGLGGLAIVAAILTSPAPAAPVSVLSPMALLNEQIDRTNFIVADRCSGTYISATHGLILTNWHCVTDFLDNDGKPKAEVTVKQGIYRNHVRVGEHSFATVIAAVDRDKDLALLRFKAGYTPEGAPAPLMPVTGKVTRGERIYIVGNPAMLEASIVEGIMSSVTRNVAGLPGAPSHWVARDLFQFSGGLYGGNSGGALYNAKGELIGVPSLGRADAWHLGFAVTVFVVHDFLREWCYGEKQVRGDSCKSFA